MSETKRFSDEELNEFKVIILKKIEETKEQISDARTQILEINENSGDDHSKDLTDFSTTQGEIEMLNTILQRQKKYLQELEFALIRIKNKNYGICVVTGTLIDKARLKAVPTTTKSMAAKLGSELEKVHQSNRTSKANNDGDDDSDIKDVKPKIRKPVIITKVIKKNPTPAPKKELDDDFLDSILGKNDDDDDDDYDDTSDDLVIDENFDVADDSEMDDDF
jgi:RNA polymerase-binding transcription factor DksA